MKTIKSKKWYKDQIAVRENARQTLCQGIDDPGASADVQRLQLAMKTNQFIREQYAAISNEINELRNEYSLYYRR